MIYIGIDPGKNGAYALIAEGEEGQSVFAYPWDDTFFVTEMAAVARMKTDVVAAVEKVGAFKGQGVKSMFTFGTEYGFIQGVLTAFNIPYQLVPPNVWKRSFSLIGKDKKASIETCQKLFPKVSLLATERSRVPSDGLAEALLLALYAKRQF